MDEHFGFKAANDIGRGVEPGRQKRQRTREDLREAAVRLIRSGPTPNLEEVAVEARVSRATAYRYFPSVEALLLEAMVHVVAPAPAELFRDEPSGDPATRLILMDEALQDAVQGHEASVRQMLAYVLQPGAPLRQGRRPELIAAALAPCAGEFTPEALELLACAVGLFVGAEGLIVAKDVLGLDDEGAQRVKRWAIEALVEAARRRPAPDAQA
ncbi:TetR/AcrR family transcriptional regulator [Phenylobacterium sp. LjRoot225]|uniref:TetR/AcrR family transcriptional regulator n=1 Tax=Phenylobacterium sp. LjRoot225 TaxID=3342285 RepID=UPI003ECD1211